MFLDDEKSSIMDASGSENHSGGSLNLEEDRSGDNKTTLFGLQLVVTAVLIERSDGVNIVEQQ